MLADVSYTSTISSSYTSSLACSTDRNTVTMLYRAIAEGNWKRPLDLSLPSTHQGELYIPFSRHIHRLNSTTSEDASFLQYSKLPTELQLQVLHWCDEPALFQLMHTSRWMRTEAKKLFFSHPETWYCLDAAWLLEGGHPGHTNYDMDFLACIERINLDFGWMNEKTWMNEKGWGDWMGTEEEAVAQEFGGMNERMQDFWRTVQHRLPSVKHIILGDDHDRWEGQNDQLPNIYKKVGEMCPPSIKVSVYLVEGDGSINHRMKRNLWRLATIKGDTYTNATQEWEMCSNHHRLDTVPPYKDLRGPVGTHQYYRIRIHGVMSQQRAIRVHRIAAMEKYHFYGRHEPFSCSVPDCDAWFEQPEEYTSHAIETKHDKNDDVPETFKGLFTENEKRLDRLMKIAQEIDKPFFEWWGEYGSEKRSVAEKEYIHQLEHDPLYAQDKPVLEHRLLLAIYRSVDADC